MFRSTKVPAGIVTLPDTVHVAPEVTVQTSAVSAIDPGVPCRSETVTVDD
jgi:hypothetical protein